MVANVLVALGTLLLAAFAFLEIRSGSRSRRAVELSTEAGRVLDQQGGVFLRDLRFAVLRWQCNPELKAAIKRMRLRYEDRIREFRNEMKIKLSPRLIRFRQDMVSAFPEVADYGSMVNDLGDPDDTSNRLSLRRFDELAAGAEVRLQDTEWYSHNTIYDRPPGLRDPFCEDPAPESMMLEILLARYRRLCSWENPQSLPRPMPEHIDHDKVRIESTHNDIRLRLVDWKQRSPEFAVFQILIFVEALDPAGGTDMEGDFTLSNLDHLRLYLSGLSGVYTSISYLDLVSHPEKIYEADDNFQSEVNSVVEALKQHLRDTEIGLRDEIKAGSRPSTAVLQTLDRAVSWGRRNTKRDDD